MSIEKDKKTNIVKRKKYSKFDTALLPVIQNAVSIGMSDADIGFLVGYSGKDARDWLRGLKKRNLDIKQACEVGIQLANIQLVSKAVQLAFGYDVKETTIIKKGKDSDPIIKEKIKEGKPDNSMLMFLLCNRMSGDFSNIKKSETGSKNLNLDVVGEMKDLIELMKQKKEKKSKQVESTVI